MARFLTGDELGNIKSLRYIPDAASGSQCELKTICAGEVVSETPNAVQALAIASGKLIAAHANGSVLQYHLNGDSLKLQRQWTDSRFQPKQKFVGLHISNHCENGGVYSCTSGGILTRTICSDDLNEEPSQRVISLPTRLSACRFSLDEETFSYGGDEVDLSVWSTEKALSSVHEENSLTLSSTTSRKRKRDNSLFPGEIWRARNVPHDSLNLRQPIRITSLSYISPSPSTTQHHLIAGTQFGDIRRYDTRVARRPVADWKGIGKNGGVRVVEKGLEEHEAFVADGGTNLFALDLRTGRVLYGYKGISGAVTSIAPSPSVLASTALDRLSRIHSTLPPQSQGTRSDRREVLQKVVMKSIPTVVLWDPNASLKVSDTGEGDEGDEDDVWNTLQRVGGEPRLQENIEHGVIRS